MASELSFGAFAKIMKEIQADADRRAVKALTALALVVEKQAKINASSGAHAYGTPTPARSGTGPARISGTLVRSITHTKVEKIGMAWETRVGTGVGFYPPYGGKRTPSNKYGYILEKKGLRNGARYPFLEPAFTFAVKVPAQLIYREAFGSGWPRVL